jgi:hypothetical protein
MAKVDRVSNGVAHALAQLGKNGTTSGVLCGSTLCCVSVSGCKCL